MKKILLSTLALAAFATPAYAQAEGSAEGSVSVDANVSGSASINDGTDGTMNATGTSATAGKFAVGVITPIVGAVLGGLDGLVSVEYDTGAFHVGGALGFVDPEGDDNFSLAIGGRFYYHIAQSALADFGVGGSLYYANESAGPDDSSDSLFIEPGIQIRAFAASNVALAFTGGIIIGAADAGGVALLGQVTGSAGVHYYF